MTHIPFKGSAPSVIAPMDGQVDLSFSTVAITLPQVKAGRNHALAVTLLTRLNADAARWMKVIKASGATVE